MMIQESGWSNKHTIHFEATDTNHRYIIKTHGCGGNSKCIAAWKKGNVKILPFIGLFKVYFISLEKIKAIYQSSIK
jgi:hypothetical protein